MLGFGVRRPGLHLTQILASVSARSPDLSRGRGGGGGGVAWKSVPRSSRPGQYVARIRPMGHGSDIRATIARPALRWRLRPRSHHQADLSLRHQSLTRHLQRLARRAVPDPAYGWAVDEGRGRNVPQAGGLPASSRWLIPRLVLRSAEREGGSGRYHRKRDPTIHHPGGMAASAGIPPGCSPFHSSTGGVAAPSTRVRLWRTRCRARSTTGYWLASLRLGSNGYALRATARRDGTQGGAVLRLDPSSRKRFAGTSGAVQ